MKKPHCPNNCADCGVDTTPPLNGDRRYKVRHEWYVVRDAIWKAAGMKDRVIVAGEAGYYLCIRCLERRVGRELRRADFTDAPVNAPWRRDSDILADRKSRP
jgi:hypothetical protein